MNTQIFKTLRITGALLLAGLVSGQVMAQTASATANTQAVVIKPITLAKATDLTFGRLASVFGTVSIAADDGARTSTNAANLIAANGIATAPGRATFTVAGEEDLTYAISGATGDIELSNGTDTLSVTLTGVYVPSKSGGAGIADEGTLPAVNETLGVGGSLELLAD